MAVVLNLDSEPVFPGCPHQNKTFWQFCPLDESHKEYNRDGYESSAPTKQNILCDNKAAATVIAKCGKSDKLEDFLSGLSDEKKMMEDITSYVTVSPKFNFRPTTRSILSENTPDSLDLTEVRLQKKLFYIHLEIWDEREAGEGRKIGKISVIISGKKFHECSNCFLRLQCQS